MNGDRAGGSPAAIGEPEQVAEAGQYRQHAGEARRSGLVDANYGKPECGTGHLRLVINLRRIYARQFPGTLAAVGQGVSQALVGLLDLVQYLVDAGRAGD